MGLTGQAVQEAHQNEPLIRLDTNRNCSHQGTRCIPCVKRKKIIRSVLEYIVKLFWATLIGNN